MTSCSVSPLPVGAGLGVLLDRPGGEPPPLLHPVVLFGRVMGTTEEKIYQDKRIAALTPYSARPWVPRLALWSGRRSPPDNCRRRPGSSLCRP